MSYFARTIRGHLERQITRFRSESTDGRKMIFMVPAMPEATMLSVADAVTNYCLQEKGLLLTLKIAANLTDTWTPQGQKTVLAKGWKDERGNLTYYRNLPETQGKCTLIVLCGADRVTDAAGLADFHTCDPALVWIADMRQSFKGWMRAKLQSSGFHDYTNDDLETFDRIIKPLLSCGRGDLLQISEWLETLNFNHAPDIADIPRIMLASLHSFDVPVLSRFPLGQKRKQLSLYINKSAEFYNYTLFLEARQRDKAIKAIDKIFGLIALGEDPGLSLDDEDVRGPYASGEEFLRGLRYFIETDDQAERDRLMKCDFVVIWDQILKFKIKESPKDKNSVRKLSGSPVEVLLTASWMTLRDFFLENKGETELKANIITINTHQFKHDVDGGDDKEENADLARSYLNGLIGGIDPLITHHINLCNPDGSEITVSCNLLAYDITCKYSKSAEPVLEFDVEIATPFKPIKRRFGWRLPEHHMYRLSIDLLKRAKDAIGRLSGIYKLPVFHLAYYEELLQATADEEIRRVLLHSIRDERDSRKVLTNLLGGKWAQMNDPLSAKLKILAEKYDIFIGDAVSKGIFATIFGGQLAWADLRKAYVDAFESASALDDINQSSMAGMLVRAFLIVGTRPLNLGETWYADVYEQSGVATILHPSVVEMLEAQVVYLARCFNYAVNKELGHTPGKDAFRTYIWRSYVDLSNIQSPLTGLLHNENRNLTANVRGHELIHRIGSSDSSDTPLSTRLLLQYNENSDEENSLSDSEMFRETSESKLLLRLMQDYFDLHPHARDGLGIAVFRNKDIQPVIAAVHAYLKILSTKPTIQKPNKRYILCPDRERPYAISVTLFTESHDETDVSSWVQQWKERWEAAETESKYELYRRCRFSIAHRIVEKNRQGLFQKLINEQFEADIAVFYNFIGAGDGVNTFEKVDPFDITSRDLKFPILEKACCTVNNPAEMYRRKRVVSNRQFALTAYHANLLHSLQSGAHQTGTVVVGSGDFTPWRGIIDCLHGKAEWVICIDSNMDERLIKNPLLGTGKTREIIGFGSGVGSHGEDNYTISTEQFSLADIYTRLRSSIQQLYAPGAGWSMDECEAVAKGILNIAPELSGLSLVRATGVGDEYIRDFMAYALSRKMLKPNDAPLCESLVSLDAYRHWFDLSDNMRRPDLMWMRVDTAPGQRLRIKMQLIECKLGQESSEHVYKAKSQIDNGLKVLSSAFAPLENSDGISGLEGERPDRRYWWMQLHRLVASKAEVERGLYPEVLAALERLAEGEFDISWSASVFAFWINADNGVKRIGYWETGQSPAVKANVYAIGGGYVRRLFIDPEVEPFDWTSFNEQGQEIVEEEGEIISPEADDDYTPWNDDETEDENDDDATLEPPELVPEPEPEITPEESSVVAAPSPLPIGDANDSSKVIPPVTVHDFPSNGPSEGMVNKPLSVEVGGVASLSGRILLGETVPNGQPVYWEFKHPELANRHMLIFGSSGQGKTYAIQAILSEMSKFRQNSLIIDYTNGFLPNHLEKIANEVLAPKQHVVRQEPLPINPFLPQVSDNGGIVIKENSNAIAKRIAGLFDSVYDIGNQQYSVLHRAIMDGVESMKSGMNLDHMLSVIQSMAEDKQYKAYAQSLHNKLRPFVLDQPFSSGEAGFDWDHLFLEQDPICNIFQLAGMDMYSGRLITEFILWDLYGHLQSKGKKTDPKVIVLDEVQNLDHKEGSPLSKYLREGRKFGLSLILATQTMSNLRKDERDRMFNAEHKLFFRPADTELKAFAEIAALATRQKVDDWIRKLSSLSKGECYSIGRFLDQSGEKLVPRALKIRITALEERCFNE
jgi:DNA phosphorothioation-dependent restriction protein DptH